MILNINSLHSVKGRANNWNISEQKWTISVKTDAGHYNNSFENIKFNILQ